MYRGKDLLPAMAGMKGRPGEQGMHLRRIVCALIGHSKITAAFVFYHHCCRCHEDVGDSLGTFFEPFVNWHHLQEGDCKTCEPRRAQLSWLDWLLTWEYEDHAEQRE